VGCFPLGGQKLFRFTYDHLFFPLESRLFYLIAFLRSAEIKIFLCLPSKTEVNTFTKGKVYSKVKSSALPIFPYVPNFIVGVGWRAGCAGMGNRYRFVAFLGRWRGGGGAMSALLPSFSGAVDARCWWPIEKTQEHHRSECAPRKCVVLR